MANNGSVAIVRKVGWKIMGKQKESRRESGQGGKGPEKAAKEPETGKKGATKGATEEPEKTYKGARKGSEKTHKWVRMGQTEEYKPKSGDTRGQEECKGRKVDEFAEQFKAKLKDQLEFTVPREMGRFQQEIVRMVGVNRATIDEIDRIHGTRD